MVDAKDYFKKMAKKVKNKENEATLEVLKLMKEDSDLYVPQDSGATRFDDSKIDIRQKSVIWKNEYVEFIFWGITKGKKMKFNKAKNPRARARWTDVAEKKHGDNWTNRIADIIEDAF